MLTAVLVCFVPIADIHNPGAIKAIYGTFINQ